MLPHAEWLQEWARWLRDAIRNGHLRGARVRQAEEMQLRALMCTGAIRREDKRMAKQLFTSAMAIRSAVVSQWRGPLRELGWNEPEEQ